MNKPKVVILGAGYGGLMTATKLQKALGVNEAEIVLVNKNNYHYETTWLHEASAGTLHHDRVRYDIKNVLDRNKVEFVQDTVVEIKPEENKVLLENGEQSYDYLVVALGGASETFGIKGLNEYAYSIVNVNAARRIREHIEYQFSTYNSDQDESKLAIVVGGAGFTGIEFLGELVERVPNLCQEYDVDPSRVKIYCVEASPTVLPGFDPELVKYAVSYLEEKGVEFKVGSAIKECTPGGIFYGKANEEVQEIKAGTVIWAAGVRGNAVIESSGIESMRARVKVEPDLRAPGFDNVFIVGDCALIINEEINRPYPPTAQIAIQQGITTARNITKLVRNQKDLEKFIPDIKGTVCSLGDHNAIGVVYGKKLVGTKASFMKKVIDNRALFMIGGISLLFRKGKFNFI
nr:NAD(P)/FAD-dependent oxidoreductase [uncultured Bacillus sp.]